MIDAVLSFHLNPQTCGVAKFNQQLAKRLGVPCLPLNQKNGPNALVSIKGVELRTVPAIYWPERPFDVLMHDADWTVAEFGIVMARRVFAASRQIAEALRFARKDVIEAFCPSTLEGNPHRGTYNVLTFGMAHKLALTKFRELKQQLEIEHPDYTISLSTAVHEGNPWDEALVTSINAMRGIFGDKLRVLGYLGDDALAKELQDCDAVAVYFDPAVRENNTTVWAALSAGKPVYTNTDEHSPVLDASKYSWEGLLRLMA